MVYVVVSGTEGAVIASRFIDEGHLGAWLDCQPGATCCVYDAVPAMGGRTVRVYRRHAETRAWLDEGDV